MGPAVRVLIAVSLFIVSAIAVFAQSPPALPAIALEDFPPAARAAISAAHREAAARPTDPEALGALGRLLHAWEQWETAHLAYGRAQALAPRTFNWWYLDAVVLQRLVRHDEAIARLRAALAADPAYLPARVRLAEGLFESGVRDESRTLFESLLSEAAAEPAARVGLGRIAASEGRHADAIAHFERAIALFPELGAAYYGVARSYRATGRTEAATRALEGHTRYGPRWPRIEDPLLNAVSELRVDARAMLQRGVSLAETGDLDAAIAAHEGALARDPTLAQAHANLVSLYGRTGNWTKVEEHYRAALGLGLDQADTHYDYGVVLGLQQRWDAAAGAYRRALAINPLHAPAHNNLGQILERERAFEPAAAAYRQAVQAHPTFRLARFNLGRMLLVLGEAPLAVAEFEQLQQPRDTEAPRYLFGLATAYVRTGRRGDGIRVAEEARLLALEHGQTELAAAIQREVDALPDF